MFKFTLYVGLNDRITKKQIIDTQKAIDFINRIMVKKIGFATIQTANGVYSHDDGSIVSENTVIITVCGSRKLKKDMIRCANIFKYAFNQESVAFERSFCLFSFK